MTKYKRRNISKPEPKKVGEGKWDKSRRTMVHFANGRSIPNTYCYAVCNKFVQHTSDISLVTCDQCIRQHKRKHSDKYPVTTIHDSNSRGECL